MKARPAFNAKRFLESAGVAKTVARYSRGDKVFTQGDACEHVLYIQTGGIKLSVLSKTGREAVVAMLGPGDFFGEGCLAGQPLRMGSATATAPTTILLVDKEEMVGLLHKEHAMSDRFIAHMLARNIRIEEDLIGSTALAERRAARLTIDRQARFRTRVIHTRITAPTKATMIEPIRPPPGQMPSMPNSQPPMMLPRIPRTISTRTP